VTLRAGGPRRRRRSALRRSQALWGWIFAAPAAIGFFVFIAGPMVASLFTSLTDWQIGGDMRFIGLGNYQKMLDDAVFWKSLRATGYFAVLSVPLSILFAFVAALLLNQARRARGFFRTLFYLPVLVPPVASSVIWLWIYSPDNGLANSMLKMLGLPPLQWIYDESTAVPSIAFMTAWAFGNMALIFLAALQGVPAQLLEAAAVDGAGPLRRMWSVTLPHVSPIILFNMITSMIAALQAFDSAYVMTKGGPNYATTFYVFYLYQQAFDQGELGYASALAWVLFVVVLVVTIILFRTSRRWVFYEAEAK
jgi:multiple sugar transport system permease protein